MSNIPDYVIYGAIALVAIILILVVIKIILNSKKVVEVESSILDVNEVGVDEKKDFTYGYEKEETIVMNAVDKEEEKKEE